MRIIVVLVIIVFLLLGAGYYTQQQLSISADKLVQKITDLEILIQEEKWSEAFEAYQSIKDDWDKLEEDWNLIMDHPERDKIATSLARLGKYLLNKEKGLSLGEIGVLEELILHIPEKEKLTIRNIL